VSLALRYAARSDVGLLRDGNEDSVYAGPRLLAVADGMGGHAAGEVASRVVIETVAVLDHEPPDGDVTEALREAVETANGYLRDMVAADGALEGMGTTLTALLWVDEQLGLVHVGDSRGYLLRNGALEPITHDHTLVQSLIDEGRISAEEATTHPQRSWITRALDGRPAVELDLSLRDAQPGDRYLLCSDGLSSYVSEETIAETLREPDPQRACDGLIELALRAGGPDNITCIVADLVEEHNADAGPIVGGAAADDQGPSAAAPETPAARAAAVSAATAPSPTADPVAKTRRPATAPDHDDDREPPSGSSGRRVVLVLASILLLVVLGFVAAFLYIRTQYYVAVADDGSKTVAIYRGVSGSVLGVDLSRVNQATDLPVDAVTEAQRPSVIDGIEASNAADAERIVTQLRTEACDAAERAAEADAAARRREGEKRAKPAPPPAYCEDGS
jgi:PPM family protein phosphatase